MHILHEIESKLDSMLGPPLPTTPAQNEAWTVYHPLQPIPTLPKWEPPIQMHTCAGGFLLNDQTACFQRGYCPASVLDRVMPVFADGFHHTVKDTTRGLRDVTYDFIVTIKAHRSEEIAAACMVELRCCKDEGTIPYLFIYELTTRSAFGHHGLAQQLVHATGTLAFLMQRCSETNSQSIWRSSLNGRRLFLGLTVDRDQAPDYCKNLVHLYKKCGLQLRTETTPHFEYDSFSPYTDRSWDPERNLRKYTAMWKEIIPNTLYSDPVARIVAEKSSSRHYHICIPEDKVEMVNANGLIPESHKCLHDAAPHSVFIMDTKLVFTRKRPTHGCVFTVLADCGDDAFEVHASIPSWFATFIGEVHDSPS